MESKTIGNKRAKVTQLAASLKHRNFRIYWFGQIAFVLGFQILQVTQLWLVYDLTGSYLKLGFVGASSAIPMILLSLFGGVVADRIDRKRLLIASQTVISISVLITTALIYLDLIRYEHLIAMAVVNGSMAGISAPSQQALLPYLIDRKDMMNAVALNSAVWQGTRIIGPGIGGLIVDFVGAGTSFLITSVGFVTFIIALGLLRIKPIDMPTSNEAFFTEMLTGVKFITQNSLFSSLIGMSFFNAFFGFAYVGIMAGFAQDILNVGASGLGLLMGASGFGALTGTLIQGTLGTFKQRGLIIICGSILFGLALILFSFSRFFPLSILLLLFVGAANSTYMIPLMTQLQISVPDELRGRVMGIFTMTYSMMPLGSLPMGAIAGIMGTPFAVAAGGGMVIISTLGIASTSSTLRKLTASDN